MELKAVKIEQVQANPDGTVTLTDIHGKGGRIRDVPVLHGYEKIVTEATEGAIGRGESKVWANIPGHMDVHGYRREYAQSMYKQKHGSAYIKYHPDHAALMTVSNALGHSLVDVVIRNYL